METTRKADLLNSTTMLHQQDYHNSKDKQHRDAIEAAYGEAKPPPLDYLMLKTPKHTKAFYLCKNA